MTTQDPEQIEILRAGGKILAEVLQVVAQQVLPGVSAAQLNSLAEQELIKRGAVPSFKNYKAHPQGPAFPASLCVSVDDEVVHGIPTKDKILKEGSIAGLDLGVLYKGLYTDGAITVGVGQVDQRASQLLATATKCLQEAIKVAKIGNYTGDIGHVIEAVARASHFTVVRELVGHGVGLSLHEDPEVPGFGQPKTGVKLQPGMVLAIEPMINAGKAGVIFASDGWTIKTVDGLPSAHFEHTVLITNRGCEILTKLL